MSRIAWKFALGLELADPGFGFSVLSEFRARLLAGDAGQPLLGKTPKRFAERGLVKARGPECLLVPSATGLGDTPSLFPRSLLAWSRVAVVSGRDPRLYVGRD